MRLKHGIAEVLGEHNSPIMLRLKPTYGSNQREQAAGRSQISPQTDEGNSCGLIQMRVRKLITSEAHRRTT